MHSWPHAPSKIANGPGMYMVTSGVYLKRHLFKGEERLELLQSTIFETCLEFEFDLQAWAILSNHYHLVGFMPTEDSLGKMIAKLHSNSSRELNRLDQTSGRKVWHQHWRTLLTFETSYLARLNYVHNNPTKHGLGPANMYPFCSAHWFETKGDRSFVESVKSFKYDQLDIQDDF